MASTLRVGDVMTRTPVVVEIDAPVAEAQDLMLDHEIRHLPVVERGRIVGVVSDRDIAALENDARGADVVKGTRVRDVCSFDLYAVAPEARLADVLAHMAERRIGSVVITEDDAAVGVFTATDACRVLSQRLQARTE